MRLATRIRRWRTVRVFGAVFVGLIAFLLLTSLSVQLHLGEAVATLLASAGLALAPAAYFALLRRPYRADIARAEQRCVADLEGAAGEPQRARELLTDFASGYTARGQLPDLRLKVLTAFVLNAEENWDGARYELGEIDVAGLPKDWIGCAYRAELAWAQAHSGAPQRALDLVDNALWMTRFAGSEVGRAMLARLHALRGICLTLVGRPADAVAPLQRSLETESHSVLTAQRCYYLGNALGAAAETYDEACRWWERARTLAPGSRWASLATEGLARPRPAPYR